MNKNRNPLKMPRREISAFNWERIIGLHDAIVQYIYYTKLLILTVGVKRTYMCQPPTII